MHLLLLFDIDGTLTAMRPGVSRSILSQVFHHTFQVQIQPEMIGNLAGKTDLQIYSEICSAAGISPAQMQEKQDIAMHFLEQETRQRSSDEYIKALPGGHALLSHLAGSGTIMGLLTGNLQPCAYHKLRPFGMDTFFEFGAFGSDHADRAFLPPVALQRAKERHSEYNFGESTTVIIGDAPGDIRCAQAHGIPVLCVATGKHSAQELQQLGANAVLPDLNNMHSVLHTIQNLTGISIS